MGVKSLQQLANIEILSHNIHKLYIDMFNEKDPYKSEVENSILTSLKKVAFCAASCFVLGLNMFPSEVSAGFVPDVPQQSANNYSEKVNQSHGSNMSINYFEPETYQIENGYYYDENLAVLNISTEITAQQQAQMLNEVARGLNSSMDFFSVSMEQKAAKMQAIASKTKDSELREKLQIEATKLEYLSANLKTSSTKADQKLVAKRIEINDETTQNQEWKNYLIQKRIEGGDNYKNTLSLIASKLEAKAKEQLKNGDEQYSNTISKLQHIQNILDSNEEELANELTTSSNEAVEQMLTEINIEKGIAKIAEKVLERVETDFDQEVKKIKKYNSIIDILERRNASGGDISIVQKKAMSQINKIVFDQNIFEYEEGGENTSNNRSESITTFQDTNENGKYELNCMTRAVLTKLLVEKYLQSPVLGGVSQGHFVAGLLMEDGTISVENQVINYNLDQTAQYTDYKINNNEEFIMFGDFDDLLQKSTIAWQNEESKSEQMAILAANGDNNPNALNSLGVYYQDNRNYQKAVEYLEKANQLTKYKNSSTLANLAGSYYNNNQPKEAMQIATKLINDTKTAEKDKQIMQNILNKINEQDQKSLEK